MPGSSSNSSSNDTTSQASSKVTSPSERSSILRGEPITTQHQLPLEAQPVLDSQTSIEQTESVLPQGSIQNVVPSIAERRHHFEQLENQGTREKSLEISKLQSQNTRLANTVCDKEAEIRKLKLSIPSPSVQVLLKEQLRQAQGELLRTRSQAVRELEYYQNKMADLQEEKDAMDKRLGQLEDKLAFEKRISSSLRSWAGSSLQVASSATDAEKSGAPEMAPFPRRPAFNPGESDGIPNWAIGEYLYDSAHDQWHESMIKQLLIRAQIAHHARMHDKAVKLAVEAGTHAYALNNMPLLARCSYHRGCAEFSLKHFRAAKVSLEEAQAAKGRYIEGDLVRNSLYWASKRLKYEESKKQQPVTGEQLQPASAGAHTVNIDGKGMLAVPTSRWFTEPPEEHPKQMSIFAKRVKSIKNLIRDNEKSAKHNRRGSSAPPHGNRHKLEQDDETVLLRPINAPSDEYHYYYNAILLSPQLVKSHRRNVSSWTSFDISTLSDADISGISDVEIWRNGDKLREKPTLAKMFQAPRQEEAAPGFPQPSKASRRNRPSELHLAQSNTDLRRTAKVPLGQSDHFDTSDADDPSDVDALGASRPPRTPRFAKSKQDFTPTLTQDIAEQAVAAYTSYPSAPTTAKKLTPKAEAFLNRTSTPSASQVASQVPPQDTPNSNLSLTSPSQAAPQSDSETPISTPYTPTTIPTNDKAYKFLGPDSRDRSVSPPSTTPSTQPSLASTNPASTSIFTRRVAFAKSPTRRKPLKAKRLSFSPPYTSPPAPAIPRPPQTPLRPPSILASLASPRVDPEFGTSPETTPSFIVVKSDDGRWGLEATDLASELANLGESLSPIGSPGEEQIDSEFGPSTDIASPVAESRRDTAVSTAVEVAGETPRGLKVRRPTGIDTVLANEGASGAEKNEKPKDSSDKGEDRAQWSNVSVSRHHDGTSPHVTFKGGEGATPTLERRVSSAEAACTPKHLVHRSPLPATPTSSYSSSPHLSPYGSPLASPHSAHSRAASVATYSPMAMSRQSTFSTPLAQQLSPTMLSSMVGPSPTRGRPSLVKRVSESILPILERDRGADARSEGTPTSPVVESVRGGSWANLARKGPYSPRYSPSFNRLYKRFSGTPQDREDEEAAIGVDGDTVEGEDGGGRFTDDEEEKRGTKAKENSREVLGGDVDEEAGFGGGESRQDSSDEGVNHDGNGQRGGILPVSERKIARAYEKRTKMPGYFDEEASEGEGRGARFEDADENV